MTESRVPADQIIDKMLALANLSATDSERALFSKQIPEILKFALVIAKIDTSGVEPMYSLPNSELLLHNDFPGESLTQDAALSTSGLSDSSNFKVPKIL